MRPFLLDIIQQNDRKDLMVKYLTNPKFRAKLKVTMYGQMVNILSRSEVSQYAAFFLSFPSPSLCQHLCVNNQLAHLVYHPIFTQLTEVANDIIHFTYTNWPATSTCLDDTRIFGVAMDILFPEVCDKSNESICIYLTDFVLTCR